MNLFNRKALGGPFDESTIQRVWEKGSAIPGLDWRFYRKDVCGAEMWRNKYGDTDSKYGWEIDHIVPLSQGGTDHITNLQPLQWENNRHKSNNYPNWSCKVKSA